jgi:hypothetical protein
MTQDMRAKRREKARYEPPIAVALGELVAEQGNCGTGVENARDCAGNGNSAGRNCGWNGNSAVGTCASAGDYPS